MRHTFKGEIYLADNQLQFYGIPVPDDVVDYFTNNKIKRLKVLVNSKASWISALTFRKNEGHFITISKENRKLLSVNVGDEVTVSLEKDNSKYGIELPEEMEILLDQDQEGNHFFHQLTAGKQRSLLYLVAKPKSSQIRINKAIVILEYLKSTGGKLDFKELNEAFKNYK